MSSNTQSGSTVLQRSFAALLITLLFVRPLQMIAESPLAPLPHAAAAPAPDPDPGMLQITILDGEGALNNIRERTAREPIVEVHDKNHKPVAGVLLFFTIRPGGAGGTFNGSASMSVYTDANGRAVAHGFMPNQHTGSYVITVTAVAGTITALALIHERNVRGAGGRGNHTARNWTIAATAAAAITVVLILILTRHNATSITAAGGTVGVP